jgi:ribose transport system permease protein
MLLATATTVAIGLLTKIINAIGVALFRIQSLIWTISINLMLQRITLVYANTASPSNTITGLGRLLGGGSIGTMTGLCSSLAYDKYRHNTDFEEN